MHGATFTTAAFICTSSIALQHQHRRAKTKQKNPLCVPPHPFALRKNCERGFSGRFSRLSRRRSRGGAPMVGAERNEWTFRQKSLPSLVKPVGGSCVSPQTSVCQFDSLPAVVGSPRRRKHTFFMNIFFNQHARDKSQHINTKTIKHALRVISTYT